MEYASLCLKNFGCLQARMLLKSVEYDEQPCYQKCDNSSLYMYFKKLGFSGFSHPVEPEVRIHHASGLI